MNKKSKLVKIDTATIEAAARDCDMTPAGYVARSVGYYTGKPMQAKAVGNAGGVTAFEVSKAAGRTREAFGNRNHTRRQLNRARVYMANADKAGAASFMRLAAKYHVTPVQVVANASRMLHASNGRCGDTCGLDKPTERKIEAVRVRLAKKYGMTVERVRRMNADKLARKIAGGALA